LSIFFQLQEGRIKNKGNGLFIKRRILMDMDDEH